MEIVKTNKLNDEDVSSIKLSNVTPPYIDLNSVYIWTMIDKNFRTLACIICVKDSKNDKLFTIDRFQYESKLEDSEMLEKFLMDFFLNMKTFHDLIKCDFVIPIGDLMKDVFFTKCFKKFINK